MTAIPINCPEAYRSDCERVFPARLRWLLGELAYAVADTRGLW